LALAQFFRADPRVLEFGPPAAIIAQRPSKQKKSVRCEETVTPLAQALGQKIINRFAYDQVAELVDWLRARREWDGKSVLICAQHTDIVPLAQALGVPQVGQTVWPHETYDRFWLIAFSPQDGAVTAFRNLPQSLLFGDAFQVATPAAKPDTVSFTQTFREAPKAPGAAPGSLWTCRGSAEVRGDFSRFDADTIPRLRLGGFAFGYYATTLGKLRQDKNAVVKTDAAAGSGSLRYEYRAVVDGREHTYAWVSFRWDKHSLQAEFQAEVDESRFKSSLDPPVVVAPGKPEGLIIGAAACYLAFGGQRFHAPAGLSYQGTGVRSKDPASPGVYQATLTAPQTIIVKKTYLPEL
jgi:hypothetical protein